MKNKSFVLPLKYKEFNFRAATNTDTYDIQYVVFTVLQEYGLQPATNGKDFDLSNVEENYFANGGFFGVVIEAESNQVIGTFGLFALDDGVCELRKMYLLKHLRGQGVGQWMLTTAISLARELGFNKIVLETISPLKEAIALYIKFGFKEIHPKEINDRVDQAFELYLLPS